MTMARHSVRAGLKTRRHRTHRPPADAAAQKDSENRSANLITDRNEPFLRGTAPGSHEYARPQGRSPFREGRGAGNRGWRRSPDDVVLPTMQNPQIDSFHSR